MHMQRRHLMKAGALAAASLALGPRAFAQGGFPHKPITLIVPFAPGGNTDLVARTFAVAFGKALGQSVVVDNRGGGGGAIGANVVARAPADGYNLLVAGGGVVAVLPEMIKTPYALSNFTPLGLVNKSSMVLLARKNETRFKNLKELADYARSADGKLTAAHSGPGTPNQLALLQLESLLKAKFTVVSYKGAGPALVDLIGGQIDVAFDQITGSMQHIKAGTLQALAVVGPTPDPALPEVPTVSQLGLGDIDGTTYLGILAAAGTPKDVLDKLSAALQQAAKDPQYVETMRTMGAVAQGSPPAEFHRILHAEQTLAQQAVKDGRLKAD